MLSVWTSLDTFISRRYSAPGAASAEGKGKNLGPGGARAPPPSQENKMPRPASVSREEWDPAAARQAAVRRGNGGGGGCNGGGPEITLPAVFTCKGPA